MSTPNQAPVVPPERRPLAQSVANVCLVVAIILVLLGQTLLGHSPEWFSIAAAISFVPALFGKRVVRIFGIALVVASVGFAMAHRDAREGVTEKIRQAQERMKRNAEKQNPDGP